MQGNTSRIEEEVLLHGKEIATLKAEVSELTRRLNAQSGMFYHAITWILAISAIVADRLWRR
jgi:hypothetical protein